MYLPRNEILGLPELRYDAEGLQARTAELTSWSRKTGTTVVIPTIWRHACQQTFLDMLPVFAEHPAISRLVVVLDQATEEQFGIIKSKMTSLPHSRIIWKNGPRINSVIEKLKNNNINPWTTGKGRSCWLALGQAIASEETGVIAFFDSDVLHFADRGPRMITNLLYPVCHPNWGIEVNKAVLRRFGGAHGEGPESFAEVGKLFARVTRIFVTPLLNVLLRMWGDSDLLNLIATMEYPLSGEVAMKIDIGRHLWFSPSYALEIIFLAELSKKVQRSRMAQTEICANYEHDHQDSGIRVDHHSRTGLVAMAHQIAVALFWALREEGHILEPASLNTICTSYVLEAKTAARRSLRLAEFSGLGAHCLHDEELAADEFGKVLRDAMDESVTNPSQVPLLPSWSRVLENRNGRTILDSLYDAVEEDSWGLN